jgi:MoaA/NifB/PqqE/SkfB family radical SAM enzyme
MKPIKSYLNLLKLRINMALGKEVLSHYPIYGIIEPTRFCNLRCPLCPTGLRLNLRENKAVDWALWKGILDEIGDYLFQLDMFNWGEPLLHKDTPEFIQYAKSKDIRVWVSSNLSAKLTDEYIQRLIRSDLDTLVVSISGMTQEIYEKYHRGGNISIVHDNMKRIQLAKSSLRIGTPTIIFKFLLFRHNEHEVETAKAEYRNWGADEFILSPACDRVTDYDQRFCKSCSMPPFEPSTLPQYNPWLSAPRVQHKYENRRPCTWLYEAFVLNPNGKVSPCCSIWDEKDDFAEYSPTTGFFAAWNSDSFRRARKLLRKSSEDTDVISDTKTQQPPDDSCVMANKSKYPATDKHIICSTCPAKWDSFTLSWPHGFTQMAITWHALRIASLLLRKKSARALVALILLSIAAPRRTVLGPLYTGAKLHFPQRFVKSDRNR